MENCVPLGNVQFKKSKFEINSKETGVLWRL
jgi:hypothetical protein